MGKPWEKAASVAPPRPRKPWEKAASPKLGGFDMVPSSPQARRDMLTPKAAPQPMAAAPGAQYSFQPTPEMAASAPMRAEVQASNEAQRAKGLIPLTTEQGTKWVADPAKQMGDIAAQQRLDRESAERREAAAAYGAGQDMIITQDQSGQLRPGSAADDDISKAILTSPQRAINAGIGAAQSIGNIPSDIIDAGLQRVHSVGGGGEQGRAPRLDIPRVPIPEGMESITGDLAQGLAQFLISRKAVGSVAPGGGTLAQVGKDALAVGAGFDGSTGRVADMLDLNAIPEGPLRDYAAWLKTQPEDSQLVGRFKNLLEDMTFSGPVVAPQMAVRGVQAVGNALTTGARAASPPPAAAVPPPQAAAQAAQPLPAPVSQPTVTQPPRGAGQPGAASAGQQAAGAVPPGGPATLQASPTVQPVRIDPEVMADNKAAVTAVSRFMRGARVPRNDVNDYVATLLSRYEPLQSERYPLAFFIEDDLPQYLQSRGYTPEQARNLAGDVNGKLQGWGRAANSFNASGNSSRYTMQDTIHQLTTTQKDELSGTFREILGDETLIGRSDEIGALMRQNGDEAYTNSIEEANRTLRDRTASPKQAGAVAEMVMLMKTPAYRELVPESWAIEATTTGRTLDDVINAKIADDPIATAHWMQSEIGKTARGAKNLDGTPNKTSIAYETRRGALLDRLETFPGYSGARKQHGDLYGADDAISFGDRFLSTARSEYKTDLMKREFDALSPRQQEVAALSIRDALLNPMLRGSPEDATARITQLQNEGTLKALVTVLGEERGEALRNAIASMRVENQRIAAISQAAGSNTHLNQQGAKDAIDNIRGTGNRLVHGAGNPTGWGVATGLSLALQSPLPLAAKAAGSVFDAVTTPGKKFQSRATRGLYGLRQADDVVPSANALDAPSEAGALPKPPPAAKTGNKLKPPPASRGPRPPPTAEQMGARIQKDQEELQRLLRQYDQIDRADPNVDDLMRANLDKQRNARRRIAEKTKKLEALSQGPKPSPAAAPQAAPKPSAAKTGGRKPPQANALAMTTGAAVGAGTGAVLNPDDPGRGAVYGAMGGAALFGGARRLAEGNALKLGSPKPKAVKPPPGAGVKPPPVGAKAFVPVEGASRIDTSSWSPTDFNAARKQLNEMMQDRRTATGQQLADLDSEITSLRRALEVDGPPPEFNDVPMASRFNAPVEGMWPKGSPEEKAIKSAIANKRWTTEPVPASKIIPTQDSVFFDYAKAAGRYAGDDRLPIMVKQGDQYFVADGHHRLMAQAGKDVVNARVIDLAPTPAGTGGKKPPAQAGFGGSKPLPMDEASRMQRAREMGFDTDRIAYRGINRAYDESGKGGGRRYQMFTSSDSDAAEYGSTVVAAYLRKGNNLKLDGGGRNFNSVSVSQLPADVRAKLHPSIQGVARIDDIADAAQKAGYDSVTVANVYDNAWGEIPSKPRGPTQRDIDLDNELLRELGIDPTDVSSTPRAPDAPAKNTDPVTIDVVFNTRNIRSKDATFDPSQEGSSKLLAGMGGKTRGVIDNLKQDAAIVGATSIAASANNPDDPAALGIPAAALLIGGKYGARLGNGLKRGPKPPPGARRAKAMEDLRVGSDKVPPGMSPEEEASFRRVWADDKPPRKPPAQSGFGGGVRQFPQKSPQNVSLVDRIVAANQRAAKMDFGSPEHSAVYKELEDEMMTLSPADRRFVLRQVDAELRRQEGIAPALKTPSEVTRINQFAKPPQNKPKPVEMRRAAPRGNKPFSDPRLSPGENKTAEMVINGHTYDEIADEMMTSVDVVKKQASRAQQKLGSDVKLPRPGMGKRPPGSTKRDAAFELFDSGANNAQIAERLGMTIGNVRTYRSYWKAKGDAPVASVNGASYNPPEMPPRPFEADYPPGDLFDGPPIDAQGRLVRDIDGRPLNTNALVIGRNKAPGFGAGSEVDQGLRDKAANIQTLKATGSDFRRTPREGLPNQTDGYWSPTFASNGRSTGRGEAVIADDIDRQVAGLDDQELMTIAHELAHSIDFKTNPARSARDYEARKWGIDLADTPVKTEVDDQLLRIYRDLNNAPGSQAQISRPLDLGYQQTDEARELWAEAIRAYMWDPNYIKTVAPDVAFLIRHNVNRNPSLRKTIQFNAAPLLVGGGGAGLGLAVAGQGEQD